VNQEFSLGASYLGGGKCRFLVWAPLAGRVDVRILSPKEMMLPMAKDGNGYHQTVVQDVDSESRYLYRLDGQKELPDPASRFQSDGVHGPSQVVNPGFEWSDGGWRGRPLAEYVIYELHVGAFSGSGTFDGVIPYLDWLKELGITAIELMPVAQFPGRRNWGYDGVYPFAAQDSYGGPEGLKRLVNACHERGLAVVLDVVYNHLGPEGNHLADFGPYFTDRYHTPWGAALNFDGADSDEVRRYFIENALCWLTEFHIDALRLDALHAILDISPYQFLDELADAFHVQADSLGRQAYLIGESDANDTRLIRERERGGHGLDAQWNDDFHHALHALLTDEDSGYYRDFGGLKQLAKAFTDGFIYSGEYSPYRRRRHGVSSRDIPAERFVVFAQNHDQVGNRVRGERLSELVSFNKLKLAAGVIMFSPFLPLVFMGEEYGETAPFPYFVSHSEPGLIEAVRRGRREEFAAFGWRGELPDPQDEATFTRARLDHNLRDEGWHRVLFEYYRELSGLRKVIPALKNLSKETMEVKALDKDKLLYLRRWHEDSEVFMTFSFADNQVSAILPVPEGRWLKRLDTAERRWGGSGDTAPERIESGGGIALITGPQSVLVFERDV